MTRSTRLVLSLLALVACGCGQPQIIDRTQPNFFKKSDLDGVWYIEETVVDVTKTPGNAAIEGYHGKMEKVRWEIQEGMVVAYRSYENNPGGDPRVDQDHSRIGHVVFQDGRPYRGNPVFGYKILSHFDRQRQYNASTGEQSNVLVEDTTDRPWYEREYMRVDWKTNLVQNVDSDCSASPTPSSQCIHGLGQAFRYITAQDQTQGDQAMVFEQGADGKLKYFDWTTQAIYNPRSVHYPGYGDIPYCLFNDTVDCVSSDVRIRTSVLKVDEDRVDNYEPLVYGEKLMKKFGLFRRTMNAYSSDYGFTESGRQLFAVRHNLWIKSKAQAPNATTGVMETQTIPVTKRDLRPVVYYLSANTPRTLWSAAAMAYAAEGGRQPEDTIEYSWDHAFRRAIAVPRGLEIAQIPQMFFVCPSPVPEGAPEACGKPGTFARPGDLRYHIIPYVEQNSGGLLGLGPSAADPETGEIVHGTANIYGVGLHTWAGTSQQVIDVLNGAVTLDQLVTGQDIKDYIFANLNPTDPRRPATGPWSSQQPLSSDSTRPMASVAFSNLDGKLRTLAQTWRAAGSPPPSKEDRKAVVEEILAAHPELEDQPINLPELQVAMKSITAVPDFNTRLESDADFYRLVARNILLGEDPIENLRDQVRAMGDPDVGCFYEYSYADEDYVGVAKRKLALQKSWETKFQASGDPSCATPAACTPAEVTRLARDEVYQDLVREAYRSIAEHEIGHTLGLRHNFIGSADALNFKDGYWDLRKETIGVQVAGQRVLPVTPRNLLDAAKPNQHQMDEGIYEYAYASTMDYGARVNAMNRGVGKYDEAAILFAYAGGYEPGWVEVFDQLRTDYDRPNISVPLDNRSKVFTARGAHVEIPLAQVQHYTPVSILYTDRFHYTTLPFHFAEQDASFEKMLDQGIARMHSRSFRKWSDMEVAYAKVEAALKNYILSQSGFYETDYTKARNIINAAGGREIPVEVPYMFCTDSEVGANLLCNRNDQGADVYEMASKWGERFNQSYVFSNFRRDRLQYSPAGVASGKFSRFLGNIPNVYQQWLYTIYYLANYYSLSVEDLDKYYGLGDPVYLNYWTMAVIDSTNTLMEQLAVPQAGYYGKTAAGSWQFLPIGDVQNRRFDAAAETAFINRVKQPAGGGYLDVLYLPRGPARSMYSVYDQQGFDNFVRINEAGHFWDVRASMLALTSARTTFLGVDRGADALRYSLPYYLTFNRELAPLFSAYWTENDLPIAPKVQKLADGTGTVTLPTFLAGRDYIIGFDYPPPPLDATGNPLPAPPGDAILPTPTWSSRFYSQVWGMAFFTENYNQEFASFNQVFRLGAGESLAPSPGFDQVSFPDPFGSGSSYTALQQHTLTAPLPAAPYMVAKANGDKAKWDSAVSSGNPVDGLTAADWEGVVREDVRKMELMRGLYDIFGHTF